MKNALILGFVLVAATGFASDRYYDEEFQVGRDAEFSLECHKGSITIRTHPVPVISVQARIYADQGKNPELVDLTEIKARAGQRFVSIDVEYGRPDEKENSFLGESTTLPLIEWTILVPDDASLELESHKSTFDIDAPIGQIKIETHKGRGSVRGVRGAFELETHKGEFEVEIAELTDLEIETHKGDILATIYGARDFSIDGEAQSHEGTLQFSGYDIPIKKEDGELIVDFNSGSGRNSIEVSTYKGKIELRFLN